MLRESRATLRQLRQLEQSLKLWGLPRFDVVVVHNLLNWRSHMKLLRRWKDEGREWTTPQTLSPEQRNRYQRHLLLPEVGEKGQLKLLDAKVLLLGAGGLGSPAAMYLAAAGVGTIGGCRWEGLRPPRPEPPAA